MGFHVKLLPAPAEQLVRPTVRPQNIKDKIEPKLSEYFPFWIEAH
jgi:hypothetical protein